MLQSINSSLERAHPWTKHCSIVCCKTLPLQNPILDMVYCQLLQQSQNRLIKQLLNNTMQKQLQNITDTIKKAFLNFLNTRLSSYEFYVVIISKSGIKVCMVMGDRSRKMRVGKNQYRRRTF